MNGFVVNVPHSASHMATSSIPPDHAATRRPAPNRSAMPMPRSASMNGVLTSQCPASGLKSHAHQPLTPLRNPCVGEPLISHAFSQRRPRYSPVALSRHVENPSQSSLSKNAHRNVNASANRVSASVMPSFRDVSTMLLFPPKKSLNRL